MGSNPQGNSHCTKVAVQHKDYPSSFPNILSYHIFIYRNVLLTAKNFTLCANYRVCQKMETDQKLNIFCWLSNNTLKFHFRVFNISACSLEEFYIKIYFRSNFIKERRKRQRMTATRKLEIPDKLNFCII